MVFIRGCSAARESTEFITAVGKGTWATSLMTNYFVKYFLMKNLLYFYLTYNFYFKTDAKSYLNAFGKLKFQNELYELRRKLSSEWYAKLDEIEEAVIQPERNQINGSNINTKV